MTKLALVFVSVAVWMSAAPISGQVLQARVWIEGMT